MKQTAMHMRSTAFVVAGMLGLVIRSSQPAMAVTVDWRTKGVVTAIEDQGDAACNPSWAFAVAGTLASEIAIAHGVLTDLSEQQLLDCDAAAATTACTCPQLGDAFSFIQDNGLCTEAAYPYVGQPGACTNSCTASFATSQAQWQSITGGNEAALVAALNAAPVIARLEVGSNGMPLPAYLSYAGGVVGPTDADASHVQWVVVVGYTDTEFIVKNSLGTGWGESGYMRLARGSNVFGIANFVYAVKLGGIDQGPVPGAPCSPWLNAPTLSPLALLTLVALLGLVSMASLYRPRRSSRPSVG